MNDYNSMAMEYAKSHGKPDKIFSMVPTSLGILGPLKGKTVVDVGCGDGFFTRFFAREAKRVYGIDNSSEQLAIANSQHNPDNIVFEEADMRDYTYPNSDAVFTPYVLNYFGSKGELETFFQRVYDSLNTQGIYAGIVDMPQSTLHDMKKFGSIKRLNSLTDGEDLRIDLYNGDEFIVTLNSYFYTRETIETLLTSVGFEDVQWHTPVISEIGIQNQGEDFWEGYIENCDVAYFSARKS